MRYTWLPSFQFSSLSKLKLKMIHIMRVRKVIVKTKAVKLLNPFSLVWLKHLIMNSMKKRSPKNMKNSIINSFYMNCFEVVKPAFPYNKYLKKKTLSSSIFSTSFCLYFSIFKLLSVIVMSHTINITCTYLTVFNDLSIILNIIL